LVVVDTRPHGALTRRRRECMACKARFSTIEIIDLEYKELKIKEAILKKMMK
jgi:transcriptional regulator NrdR family protein